MKLEGWKDIQITVDGERHQLNVTKNIQMGQSKAECATEETIGGFRQLL